MKINLLSRLHLQSSGFRFQPTILFVRLLLTHFEKFGPSENRFEEGDKIRIGEKSLTAIVFITIFAYWITLGSLWYISFRWRDARAIPIIEMSHINEVQILKITCWCSGYTDEKIFEKFHFLLFDNSGRSQRFKYTWICTIIINVVWSLWHVMNLNHW